MASPSGPLDGEESLQERSLFFHFPVYLEAYRMGYDDGRDPLFRTRPGSVIIHGNWKLHYYYEDEGTELYDLDADPGEWHNLASEYPEKMDQLRSELRTWLEKELAPTHFDLNPQFDSLFVEQATAPFY